MNPKPWHRATALFEHAIELPPEERASFLEQHCHADAELRRTVEVLLSAYGETPPAPGSAPLATASPPPEPRFLKQRLPPFSAKAAQVEQSSRMRSSLAARAVHGAAPARSRRGLPNSR